jgi:hypothetical protein
MNIDGEAAWLFYFTLGNFNLRVGISPTRPEMSELLFEDPKKPIELEGNLLYTECYTAPQPPQSSN